MLNNTQFNLANMIDIKLLVDVMLVIHTFCLQNGLTVDSKRPSNMASQLCMLTSSYTSSLVTQGLRVSRRKAIAKTSMHMYLVFKN